MDFSRWHSADRLVITYLSKTTVKSITDRAVITQVADFAESRNRGWEVPWAGTPVSRVTLEFYAGPRFLGHLGIGKSFLEAQGCDDFVSRALSAQDRRDMARLMGISDNLF